MTTNHTPTVGTTAAEKQTEQLWTLKDVAHYLQLTTRTVQARMASGHLPYFKLAKSVRFSKAVIDQHLATHCKAGR